MKRFSEFVIRNRTKIILAVLILTLFFGYSLRKMKVNSDILSYLPQDDPVVILFNEVGDKFGGNSLAMVAFETEDVFNYQTLNRINQITEKFKRMDELSHVISLTDVLDIKKIEGGLEVGRLIDKYRIPQDKEELQRLKEYTLSKDMYRGSLVSSDGKVTVIISRLKQDVDKIATARHMKEMVKNTQGSEKLYFAGIPFQMISLTEIIMSDLVKLIPLVAILVIIILFLSFGSLRGVILPSITVVISTVWALGIMSLFRIPLTIVSNGMPVLLIAIGSAYGIHMLSKYNEDIRKGEDKIQGIKDALSEVGIPIFFTGVTTLIGFLSFLSSNLSLIREFGVFTAIGVMFAMIISMTFLPAVLSFLKVKEVKVTHTGKEDDWITKLMDKLSALVLKREKLIIAGGIIILILSLIAIPRIHREVNMVDYFKKESDLRQAEDMMEEKLGGSIPIQVLIKGDIKDPFVLKNMIDFEKYLKTLPDVHNPQSVADLICEMNDVMNDHYTIPDTKEKVANLWFFIEGEKVLDQLIDEDSKEALVQAKLGTVNTRKMINMVDEINHYLEDQMKTDLVKVRLVDVSPELKRQLEKEQVDRIFWKINLDLSQRDAQDETSELNLRKAISNGILTDMAIVDDDLAEEIGSKLHKYFNSGQADIEIESKEVVAQVTGDISQKLREKNLSEENIIDILKEDVPEKIYADDPEILGYTAESIVAIIDEEKKWARLNHVIQQIKPLLPENLREDKDFLEDLRDDIWEINEDWVSIEYSKHSNYSEGLDPEGRIKLTAQQTGMPIIFKDLDENILKSQILSLSIALVLVLLLLSFQFRSLVGGLISIVPIVLTILVNFTLMGFLRIPLDAATVMIGSVAVGIGIDYTIHFTSRFRYEFEKSKSERQALDKTLETTGKAIVINAASVMMGFLVLVLGSIVPMQRFGYLIALTMVISALGSITFLPALILVTRAKFIGDFEGFKISKLNELKEGVNNFIKRKRAVKK
jgi:predicted RND superfamily exporter protein